MILDHHLPCPDRLAVAVAPPRPPFDDRGALLAFSVHVDPRVEGIFENGDHVAVADRQPVEAGHAPFVRGPWEVDLIGLHREQYLARAAEPAEAGEDKSDHLLETQIGIETKPNRYDKPNLMMGLPRCMTFGGPRVDAAIGRELLLAVEPMAIDAAFEAERMHREQQEDQQRIRDLEMQQARYEASLAERRYAACDPDNRLIAAQLEKNWEAALRRVRDLETRQPAEGRSDITVDPNAFTNLADNLSAAWNAPGVTMRARQQLLRTLITDIIVDVDDDARDVVLTIHWRGGQHSELRVRKPRAGEHGCATAEDALAVMRSMAGRWSDEHIAASLNRMGLPTGQGKSWTAHRVASVRRVRGIHAYRSAEKDGEWLTMTEAAKALD